MTQRGRRSGFRRSSSPRRAREWFDTIVNTTVSSAGQAVVQLGQDILDDEKKGMTIVRLIIDLVYQLSAVGTGGVVSSGICLVTDDAFGASVLPEADVSSDKPGWWYRSVKTVYSATLNDRAQATNVQYDLKIGRKLPGEDVAISMIFDASALSSDVNIDGLVRLLALKS